MREFRPRKVALADGYSHGTSKGGVDYKDVMNITPLIGRAAYKATTRMLRTTDYSHLKPGVNAMGKQVRICPPCGKAGRYDPLAARNTIGMLKR